MIDFFKRYPSKILTNVFLVSGLIIFLIIYSYLLKLFQDFGFSMEEYNAVWLSFDASMFRAFLEPLITAGQAADFLVVFKLNIISITAFMLAFCCLSLVIARQINPASRLHKIGFVFPLITILIALFDIIPSILMLTCTSGLVNFPAWLAVVMSGGYVIRVILLYLVLFWYVFALGWFVIQKRRLSKNNP